MRARASPTAAHRVPPRWIGPALADAEGIASVEVAGPGFINIRLEAGAAGALAKTIVEAGAAFGTNTSRADEIINLEFVSANPTGPGPATSTLAMPSASASAVAISCANSRGFAPTALPSLRAAFEAQSPWSRLRGRSSGRSATVRSAADPVLDDAAELVILG
jgi:hypothetical protein